MKKIQDVFQLNELLSMYGEERSDYSKIDENVSTENQSFDVAEIISSMQQSAEELTVNHSDDGEGEEKKKRNSHRLISEKL